jgi:hypothetical protein
VAAATFGGMPPKEIGKRLAEGTLEEGVEPYGAPPRTIRLWAAQAKERARNGWTPTNPEPNRAAIAELVRPRAREPRSDDGDHHQGEGHDTRAGDPGRETASESPGSERPEPITPVSAPIDADDNSKPLGRKPRTGSQRPRRATIPPELQNAPADLSPELKLAIRENIDIEQACQRLRPLPAEPRIDPGPPEPRPRDYGPPPHIRPFLRGC